MIEKYQILYFPSIEELEEAVQKEIAYGWQPLGGVAVDQNGNLAQAMAKYLIILQTV